MRIGRQSILTAVYIGIIILGIICYNAFGTSVSGNAPAVYVAKNGSDSSGDGTESNPFASLSKAAETAVPGSVIYVRGGTYEQTKETIVAEGTADAPIVIRPYPGEFAVFDGAGANIREAESIIKISHSSHVVFEGFELRNSAARGLSVYESNHILVRHNRIHETVERGLGGGGHYLTFDGNEIWRASLENENEAFNARGGWKAGLSTYKLANGNPSTNITIRNNYIHDNWGEGIIAIFAENVVIEGNKLHDNYSVNLYLDNASQIVVQKNHLYTTSNAYNRRDKQYPAHGIHMANERYSAPTQTQINDVVIANNLIVGTGRGISFWHDSSNNSRENSYAGIEVVYNVVKDTHDHAVWFDSVGATADNRLHNNIIFAGQNGRLLDISNSNGWAFSHNNWPDEIPGVANEPNSFSAMPNFVNPEPNGSAIGYQLQAGDRSIDAGVQLNRIDTDYWGQARNNGQPSLGIHEFGGESESPEPVEPTATAVSPTATATTEPTVAPTEPPPTATDIAPTATSAAPTEPAPTATGVAPTATTTVIPPAPTVTPTVPAPTATPAATHSLLYLSTSSGDEMHGLEYDDEDVLSFDLVTQTWQLYFDGSDVGVRRDIDALAVLDNGRLLLSLDKETNIPGLGPVDDSDIFLFIPEAVGEDTNGRFAWFFDGSDVGLTKGDEDVNAFTLLPDGRLLISTKSSFKVDSENGTLRGKDEDLLLFTPTSLGDETAGTWQLYFDGSNTELEDEDIWGVWLEPFSSTLYLSIKSRVGINDMRITNRDIFTCQPQRLGEESHCLYASSLFWAGESYGLDERLDAISMHVAVTNETAVSYQYLAPFLNNP